MPLRDGAPESESFTIESLLTGLPYAQEYIDYCIKHGIFIDGGDDTSPDNPVTLYGFDQIRDGGYMVIPSVLVPATREGLEQHKIQEEADINAGRTDLGLSGSLLFSILKAHGLVRDMGSFLSLETDPNVQFSELANKEGGSDLTITMGGKSIYLKTIPIFNKEISD